MASIVFPSTLESGICHKFEYDLVKISNKKAFSALKKNGKWILTKPDGENRFSDTPEFEYDLVNEPSEGVAAVMKKKKWFHVSLKTGKPIYKDKYDQVTDFLGGKAQARIGNKLFALNLSEYKFK